MEPLLKAATTATTTPTPKKKKDSFEIEWKGKTYRAKYDLLKAFYGRESETHVRCRMEGCGKHSIYQHKPNCGYSNVFGHLNSKHKDWKEKLIKENPEQCYEIVKVASDITETELPSQLKFTQARYTLESESDSEQEVEVVTTKKITSAPVPMEETGGKKKGSSTSTSILGKRKSAKVMTSSTPSTTTTTANIATFVLPEQFIELGKDRTNPIGKMMDLFLQYQHIHQDYQNQLLQLHYEQEQWRKDQELREQQLQETRDTESHKIMMQMMTLFLQSQPTTATTAAASASASSSSNNVPTTTTKEGGGKKNNQT